LKRQLRKEVQQRLKTLTVTQVAEESRRCANKLFQLPQFIQSRRISIYLSMASGELQTRLILQEAFDEGKIVFVPVIDDDDMAMVESHNLADVDGFHTNRWGIPEPQSLEGRIDALKQKVPLDLIIVPGVGFDRSMNRIGHGKGYYDRFTQRCYDQARQTGQEPPTLIALALKAQLMDNGKIPTTEDDWKMDAIIVDGEVIEPEDV